MPQYPDLMQLQNLTDPFAMLQAGQMAYDSNQEARQQAIQRELANAQASKMNPMLLEQQGLANQSAVARLPGTRASSLMQQLSAERDLANQPIALDKANYTLSTLPEAKKQEFLNRLPQTATELRMFPPEAHANYVKGLAGKYNFDPQLVDQYLNTNAKDVPSALLKLHSEMSLNSPKALQQDSLLNSKNDAAMERAMANNETRIMSELLKQQASKELASIKLSSGVDKDKNLEALLTRLVKDPNFATDPDIQTIYHRAAGLLFAKEQAKVNEVAPNVMGQETPTERGRAFVEQAAPLANKNVAPTGQPKPQDVRMDIQSNVLKQNKLDPNKYKVIFENGQYFAVKK